MQEQPLGGTGFSLGKRLPIWHSSAMVMPETAKLERFAADCRRAAREGLVRCSSGNISQRADESSFLISASRSWLGRLRPADIAVCRLADGASLNGVRPSVETSFHAAILRNRPEVAVVLHFQTPAATAIACSSREITNFHVIPEIPYYIGAIARVPYLAPGSPELAQSVTDAMRDRNLAILQNHGQVVVGCSFDDVIQKAVFFELACEILLRLGSDASPLPPDAARALTA